jgi:hypothetical protein
MSTLFNPTKKQLEQAALVAKKIQLLEKDKTAAREQLLRIQLILDRTPRKS